MADRAQTARLVIHDLDSMDAKEHFRLIRWLRQQADFMEQTPPDKFARRFIARLFKQ